MAEGTRPGTATGAAIIEIVFGAIGIIVSIVGLAGSVLIGAGAATMGAVSGQAAGALGIVGILTLITSLAGLALGVIGLIAGILVISNKKNGITLSNIWIWGVIALFVVGIITSIMNMSSLSGLSNTIGGVTVDFGIGALILGIVWGLVWQVAPPVVVFILLSLKPVKEFLAKAA